MDSLINLFIKVKNKSNQLKYKQHHHHTTYNNNNNNYNNNNNNDEMNPSRKLKKHHRLKTIRKSFINILQHDKEFNENNKIYYNHNNQLFNENEENLNLLKNNKINNNNDDQIIDSLKLIENYPDYFNSNENKQSKSQISNDGLIGNSNSNKQLEEDDMETLIEWAN
ncbi:unnamed protein product [Schistosoma rodhaini]|nr:unnamed protein product [Schistosoma rodhaini]